MPSPVVWPPRLSDVFDVFRHEMVGAREIEAGDIVRIGNRWTFVLQAGVVEGMRQTANLGLSCIEGSTSFVKPDERLRRIPRDLVDGAEVARILGTHEEAERARREADLIGWTVETLYTEGEREAFNVLYSGIASRSDADADAVCREAAEDASDLTLDLMVGLLTITLARRDRLPSRAATVRRARRMAADEGSSDEIIDRLFRGLD